MVKSPPSTVSRTYLGFVGLMMLLGMQLLRVFLPLLLFVLRDRFGWSAVQLGLLALLVFLMAGLAAVMNRWLGTRRLLVGTAVTMLLARLLVQWWTADPVIDLVLAGVGVVAFGLFLPVLSGYQMTGVVCDHRSFVAALGSGLLLDLALHGAFLTYDLAWQQTILAHLLLTVLVLAAFALLIRLRPRLAAAVDPPGLRALAWSAIGPLLGLQLLVFLNLARLTTLTGWLLPMAYVLLLLAHLTGIGLLFVPLRWQRGVVVVGVVLLLVTGWPQAGWATAVFTLLGPAVLMLLLYGIFLLLVRHGCYTGLGRLTAAHTLGNVLLVALIFITYARFDIRLPLDSRVLLLTAVLWTASFGLLGLLRQKQTVAGNGRGWPLFAPLLLLFLLPAWQTITWQTPQLAQPKGALRVMTYNLHNGFNPQGLLDLEALAQVIAAENVDVVGLQEVSRGWVVNGSTDMLTWLAQRLEMTAVFTPTADDLWGVAILTRVPISSWDSQPLPPDTLLLRRGWQRVVLNRGPEPALTLINTHLHHPRNGGEIRQQQIETLLAAWANTPHTLLLGDFNAEPGAAEMDPLWAAGWQNSVGVNGVQPPFTSPVPNPTRQIDYILTTPDLRTWDVAIPTVPASDHLAVAAWVE